MFPNHAIQCMQLRSVACVGMEHEICEEYVLKEVHELNRLIGAPLLHYIGEYEIASGQGLYDSGVYVVGYGELKAGTLGVTYTETSPASACIEKVFTALDHTWARAAVWDYHLVLLHELTHGIGFDHASESSRWNSYMGAAYREGGPTPLDIATLRAVYGR